MALIPTARPGLAEPGKSAPATCSSPSKAELQSREQPGVSLIQGSSLGGPLLNPGLADEGLSEPPRQPQRTQSDTGATLGKPLWPPRQRQPLGDQAAHGPSEEQPGLNPPAAQPVRPGSGPHQALTSSPLAGVGQQHGSPKAPAEPSRQQPGAQPQRVAAGGNPANAERRQQPAAEAQQPGRPRQPPSASHLSGSLQQQGPAGPSAAGMEAAGPAGKLPTMVKPKVKRKKPTGPLWACALSSPPVASSTLTAASSGPEARAGVFVAPAAMPTDAGASAAQSPARGSAVSDAAGDTPSPMLPGAGQTPAEAVAAQGSNIVLADMSMASLPPPQKHDTIRAQKHAGRKAPLLVPQHGATAEQQQQQQPSTSRAAAAAASPVLISTEQQQQPASTKAAADPAAASPMDISTEQQWRPVPSDAATKPWMTRACGGNLPVDAELDMFAEPDQQPTAGRGAALRRQQELVQALGQVAASAPGMVLPAEPQPRQGARSIKAEHAAAPQGVQQPAVTAFAQDAHTPQDMLPAVPAGAGTVLCSRQAPELPIPAAACPQSSEQVLPPSAADAAARKEIRAIASPVAAPQSSHQLSPPHAAAAGAGKASSSRQRPQQQGDAEAKSPSSPQKRPKPAGWNTVGTWQAGQFVGLKSPLSPSTGPLQPAGTSSAGQAAAPAEAAAGREGSSPTPPLGQQQSGGARPVPAWCVDCPGGPSAPQRQELMLQMAEPGRLLGVPALAELRVVWTHMRGRLWPSSGT